MFGLESEEPSDAQRREYASQLSARMGVAIEPPAVRHPKDFELRPPRIEAPDSIAAFCLTDNYERARHSHRDYELAIRGEFPNPPDVVAHPSTETELEAVLEWCSSRGYAAIPFGGGSSSVDGFTPPEGYDGIVTIDMDRFDRVLEMMPLSVEARSYAEFSSRTTVRSSIVSIAFRRLTSWLWFSRVRRRTSSPQHGRRFADNLGE